MDQTTPTGGAPEVPRKDNGAEVVVLGAGIAGLSAADMLVRAGHKVIVVEQSDRCGGTHRSREIGPYTFDVGSIFYEENARIFDLAPGLKDICPPTDRIQRRITPEGEIRRYPIEPRDLLRWPKPKLLRGLADLAVSRVAVRRNGTLDAMCRIRLGATFYDGLGLKSYISRFNHVLPEEIDESFFFYRMGFIERMTRVRALARSSWRAMRKRPFNSGPGAALYVRPAEGFGVLFDRVRASLEERGVRFAMSETLERIAPDGAGFAVTTSRGTRKAGVVVGTVPLDTLHRALFDRPAGLRSIDMLTLFVSAGSIAPEAGNLLFNFHHRGRWKRATIYSRIYPDHAAGREFFAAEVTLPPGHPVDPDAAFADLTEHMEALGVATDLVLEGHEHIRDCYPLYSCGSPQQTEEVLARVAKTGVVTVGRQGRFEYLPTSSGVIKRVAEELEVVGLSPPDMNATVPAKGVA